VTGLGLAGRGFERCDATESSKGCLVAAAAGVRPGHEDLRGHEHTNPGLVEQCRHHRPHERDHRQLEFAALVGELSDPVRGATQRQLRRGVLRVCSSIRTKPLAPSDQVHQGPAAEFLAQIHGGGDDKRLENVDSGDPREFRAVTGDNESPQPFARSARSWGRPGLAAQNLARSADGVQRVRLRSVLRWASARVVELDDELALRREGRRQSSAVAPGGLDRPRSPSLGGVFLRPAHCLPVATGGGGEGPRRHLALGS